MHRPQYVVYPTRLYFSIKGTGVPRTEYPLCLCICEDPVCLKVHTHMIPQLRLKTFPYFEGTSFVRTRLRSVERRTQNARVRQITPELNFSWTSGPEVGLSVISLLVNFLNKKVS